MLEYYTVAIVSKNTKLLKSLVANKAPGTRGFADRSDHLFIAIASLAATERTSSFPFSLFNPVRRLFKRQEQELKKKKFSFFFLAHASNNGERGSKIP